MQVSVESTFNLCNFHVSKWKNAYIKDLNALNAITPICEFITDLEFNTDYDLITEFWRFP